MELFDALDCAGNKTGESISRDEAHRTGAWHGAFHCLIIYEREGAQYALFQKRSLDKKITPGKFDVSVGGHYATGEDASSAGPREIREELGLEVAFRELVLVGKRVFVYGFAPGVKECEFQDVFLLPVNAGPENLRLQEEEVDGVLELEVEEGIRLFSGQAGKAEGRFFAGNKTGTLLMVSKDDFVPNLDNYYLKLLILARRYFEGERVLVI